MTSLTDRTIEADRRTYDNTAALVRGLSDDDLLRPSGASEWSVAQVLSHLGSGAEIARDGLRSALAGEQGVADANQAVWARWDAMSPREQADGFLESGAALTAAYDALDAAQRAELRIDMGFLPEPATLALYTGMRLNEALLHSWDVAVAFDDTATLPEADAAVLVEQLRGPLGFLLGFIAKPGALGGRTVSLLVRPHGSQAVLGLEVGDAATLGDAPSNPDGELSLSLEALLRLVTGRLGASYPPAQAQVTGPVSLDDLRQVFPGY